MKKNKLDIYLKNLLLSIILNIDKIYSVLGSESKNGINYNCKYEQQLRAHTILSFKMVYNLNILLNEKKRMNPNTFSLPCLFESRFHIRAQDYYY
jgi:hypothetical protein